MECQKDGGNLVCISDSPWFWFVCSFMCLPFALVSFGWLDESPIIHRRRSEIGSHILSGNVFDPKALEELFSSDSTMNWTKDMLETVGSHATPVSKDQFQILTESGGSYTIPNLLLPPQLNNHGNYVISLSQLCRWLATKAEELGVEIYPGFAASEVLIDPETGSCYGIATRDVGVGKDGQPKSTFERGVELQARQTLFAEGARGSCSEFLMQHYQLRQNAAPQTYGLGLKEVWQIPPEKLQPGLVQHTLGFPLQQGPFDKVFGGSFLYHQEPDLVLVGLVIGLDYANPHINPYQEFQRFKTHAAIRPHLEGGTCLSYGARVLNEGGYHSLPKLVFPGGALIGCSAGFLNAVKIKGSHTAMKSGMLAAQAVHDALTTTSTSSVAETGELPPLATLTELSAYPEAIRNSWIHEELYQVRNCHQAFSRWGVGGGLLYSGIASFVTKGREPWTLSSHAPSDAATTEPTSSHAIPTYPPADNVVTFDLLTNLQRSGTYHTEDQPSHLRIKEVAQNMVTQSISLETFGGPEQRFCPAAVYEYVDDPSTSKEGQPPQKSLVINAQNCLHCKCCSIKMPGEYIDWTVPEGGGGPQYQVM